MPNRIISEACRRSESLDLLSDAAERFFWRLVTVADDHGLFDADPRYLASTTFQLRRRLKAERVVVWLEEMRRPDVDCVALYACNGHTYGAFLNWFRWQRPARSKPKHPLPPDDIWQRMLSVCQQPETIVGLLRESRVVSRETRVESRESVNPTPDSDPRKVLFTTEQFVVPEVLLLSWGKSYPAVDVPAQVKAAHSWALSNPANRKSNWARFLNAWLKREQDRAPRVPPPSPPPSRAAIQDLPALPPEEAAANMRRLGGMVRQVAAKKTM